MKEDEGAEKNDKDDSSIALHALATGPESTKQDDQKEVSKQSHAVDGAFIGQVGPSAKQRIAEAKARIFYEKQALDDQILATEAYQKEMENRLASIELKSSQDQSPNPLVLDIKL